MANVCVRIHSSPTIGPSQGVCPSPPIHPHSQKPRSFAGPLQAAAAATFSAPFSSSSGSATFLSPSPHAPTESFLSRYALGGALGQGANGTVLTAFDRVSGNEVAVKIVPKHSNSGRHQRSALHREATLWRKAVQASRQACRFLSIEEDASSYYIVSEKCNGGSLQKMLDERGALTEAELSQVAWCILSFLSDMHKHSMYYGDLKPGNVILKDVYPCVADPNCLNVRVVDFGCSRIVSDGSALRGLSGSPLFLAPEIIKGSYGLPADMWAFGVTIFMLICNRLPFWLEPVDQLEEQLDVDDISTAIQYSPVLFAGKHWRGVSEPLKDLICGLLEKDPARRLTAGQAMEHPWFAGARDMCAIP